LHQAAVDTITRRKDNFYKYWWDTEAKQLKQDFMSSHREWINIGRPDHGRVFELKAQCKSKYKTFIFNRKSEESSIISDSLCNSLVKKDNIEFWKIWNRKFSNKQPRVNNINGCCEEKEIANNFRDFFIINQCFFRSNVVNNNVILSDQKQNDYTYSMYNKEYLTGVIVETIVNKLKKGKAMGEDNLSCEHLQFCHPIVLCTIAKLFNVMINHGYVPDAFGRGIIVPIPKSSKRNYNTLEDYRGITISCILSKVFEHCLLLLCGHSLKCSERVWFQKISRLSACPL